jgi:hypothetical protein
VVEETGGGGQGRRVAEMGADPGGGDGGGAGRGGLQETVGTGGVEEMREKPQEWGCPGGRPQNLRAVAAPHIPSSK